VNLTTQAGAQTAIDIADAAVTQLGDARAVVGAGLHALSAALDQARVAGEMQANGAARIFDGDVAADAATLAREQLLSQTGNAALQNLNLSVQNTYRLIAGSLGLGGGSAGASQGATASAALAA
jgi:flagellin